MTICTFLLGKAFKKKCQEIDEITNPVRLDGRYSPFECLINPNKTMRLIRCQAELQDIANLVDEKEMKDFISNKDVQDGLFIYQGTAMR